MTQEIGGMQQNRRDGGPPGGDPLVALVVGDGQEDWMLPEEAFIGAGCKLVRASSFAEVEERCTHTEPDLVFMPLTLDGKLTIEHLRTCLTGTPQPVVVVVASNDQINTAAEAMRIGAYDCLFKPFSRNRLGRTIEAAVKHLGAAPTPSRSAPLAARATMARLRADHGALDLDGRPAARAHRGIDTLNLARRGFVATSPQMQAVLETAAVVARSEASVFLSGEVGTGKSTLAGIIHELSSRAGRPMVTLTCATLSAGAFEALMSGSDGALSDAAGGTLYLDEITDLPSEVQPKVVRLLETAATAATGPGIRVIASTSEDPYAALRTGRIRPELFYRLHVAPIELPPLRQRDGDPALIARVRLAEFSEAEGRSFVGFSDTALAMIAGYHWPGNLRELINVIHTVVLMNEGALVTPDLLPPEIRAGLHRPGTPPGEALPPAPAQPAPAPEHDVAPTGLIGKTLAEIERTVIEATILAEDGSVPRAARVLDVSPSTLYRKREAWAKGSKP